MLAILPPTMLHSYEAFMGIWGNSWHLFKVWEKWGVWKDPASFPRVRYLAHPLSS